MNPAFHIQAAIASIVLTIGFVSQPVHAANRCDQPTVGAEARACAASRDGPDALRRFVYRTRGIYGLRYADFQREDSAMSSTSGPTRTVDASGVDSKPDAAPGTTR